MAQVEQAAWPVLDWAVPAAPAMHELAPALEKVPAAQAEHATAPVPTKAVPAAQSTQTDAPVWSW